MLSFLSLILHRKKAVIIAAAAGFAASAALSLVLPKRFISTTAFIPRGVEQELTGTGNFLNRLGIFGESYATFIRVRRNFVIDYIVRSNRMASLMDARFGLKEMYGTDSDRKMREKLGEKTFVNVRDEGVIELSVEASGAVLARDMAAAYVELTDSILIDLNIRIARDRREYLEEELARIEGEMAARDSMLSSFMASTGVFEIEQQAKAAFELIGALSVRISILEIERSVMSMNLREGSDDLQRLDLEIEKLKAEVAGAVEGEGAEGLFPPLSDMPELATEYLGMMAERMAGEFSLAYIRLKLEDARISAERYESVVRVIDPPFVPDQRSWPKRKQIVIILTLATVFWTCFVIALRDKASRGGSPVREGSETER